MATVTYDFNTNNAPTIVGAGVTATDLGGGTQVGPGQGSANGVVTNLGYATGVYQTSAAASTTTAQAVTNGAYFYCDITAPAGYTISRIQLKAARGGASAPRSFKIRSSADNYAADVVANQDIPSVRTTLTSYDFTGLSIAATAVTLRIYIATPATGSSIEFDDVIITLDTPSSGGISGSTTLNLSGSGTVLGTGAITGSSTLLMSPTAALTGKGAITGSSTLVLSPAGTVSGIGQLSGSTGLTLAPAATLLGKGALLGSTSLTLSGSLLNGPTPLVGLASFSFAPSATLRGKGQVSGSLSMLLSGSGTLHTLGQLWTVQPPTSGSWSNDNSSNGIWTVRAPNTGTWI